MIVIGWSSDSKNWKRDLSWCFLQTLLRIEDGHEAAEKNWNELWPWVVKQWNLRRKPKHCAGWFTHGWMDERTHRRTGRHVNYRQARSHTRWRTYKHGTSCTSSWRFFSTGVHTGGSSTSFLRGCSSAGGLLLRHFRPGGWERGTEGQKTQFGSRRQ